MELDEQEELRVERTRRFNPFTEISRGHWVLIENLKEKRPGWHYEAMACNVSAAFKCEALLNEIGDRFIKGWVNVERLSWRNKLDLIAAHFDWKPEYGSRPLQTVVALFRARDQVAHAKPIVLKSDALEKGTREELRRRHPQTDWEKLCTIDFAVLAYEETEQFANMIAGVAGLDEKQLRHAYAAYTMPSKST
jgi:hypothetical protein